MTTLEAINKMLGAINESPVSSLDTGGSSDAANAERILDRVSSEIQAQGWHCNTEQEVTLSPNDDHQIDLPDEYLRIEPDGYYLDRRVARRGTRLYDLKDHTFTFTSSLTCTIIKLLDFTDLTAALQSYIICKAAREFQQEVRGGQLSDAFAADKELQARINAMHEDADNANFSLKDAGDMRRMLGNRDRTGLDDW